MLPAADPGVHSNLAGVPHARASAPEAVLTAQIGARVLTILRRIVAWLRGRWPEVAITIRAGAGRVTTTRAEGARRVTATESGRQAADVLRVPVTASFSYHLVAKMRISTTVLHRSGQYRGSRAGCTQREGSDGNGPL